MIQFYENFLGILICMIYVHKLVGLICCCILLISCTPQSHSEMKSFQNPPLEKIIDFSQGKQTFTIYVNTPKTKKWSIGFYLYAKPIRKLPFFKYPTPNNEEYQNFNRILGIKNMENNGLPAEIGVRVLEQFDNKIISSYETRYPMTNAYYKGRVAEMIVEIPKGKHIIAIEYNPILVELSNLYGEIFIREPYNGK